MDFDLQPTLTGRFLEARPLRLEDWPALFSAASDPMIWEQHPEPDRYKREVFQKFFDAAMESGGALAIVELESGRIIGSSRYYKYNRSTREIMIGYTFIEKAFWGRGYNAELKALMLGHAFQFVDRVLFEVGRFCYLRRYVTVTAGMHGYAFSRPIEQHITGHRYSWSSIWTRKEKFMLKKLFIRGELRRYLDAPLLDEREHYLTNLEELGTARVTLQLVAGYQLIIVEYLGLQRRRLITLEEVLSAGDRWAKAQAVANEVKHPDHSKRRFVSFASRWLHFIGWMEIVPVAIHPYANTLHEYAVFMRDERLLAAETIKNRCGRAGDFLTQLCEDNISLADMSIGDVDRILVRKRDKDCWARTTIRAYVDVLRSFLRFAEQRRLCGSGMVPQLVAPRIYKGETLPAGPSWEEVQKLSTVAETDQAADIRDRAIILLFSVYGFRRSEVGRLTLDDFDWNNSTIRIRRSKRLGRTQLCPLSQVVGEAVIRYLKEVRPPSAHRQVFIRLNAPLLPLSDGALTQVIIRRQKALGIRLPHYGPHALRHACACRLLAEGVSMKAIGDHLGHTSVGATAIYAKVDLKALRAVGDFSLEGLL